MVDEPTTFRFNKLPNDVRLDFITVGAIVVEFITHVLLIIYSFCALIFAVVNKVPLKPMKLDILYYNI
jgi:hypothetical protein